MRKPRDMRSRSSWLPLPQGHKRSETGGVVDEFFIMDRVNLSKTKFALLFTYRPITGVSNI